ncbi:HotDog domain-containing protein [Lasiosphaeria miniovina]|uniref:HotDog domain-containing protein n=1 Tax=Lasiosphaeria miniovina TaxID=1954250 RepID=A0AA40DQV4_9PEZI|nr:HotDog domain-containing protein [Lasiosphaeria miniovina]KAK0709912.1 HotDog domain-containing protein [Lasiosphaeria miniovina]
MGPRLPPARFVRSLRVTDASEGKVEFELEITKDHTNRLKILHGGTIASMVDLGGSLAVASMGLHATGVSTDMNSKSLTYLSSGGKIGEKIQGTATCEKIGKTLAFTTVTFRNQRGELAARGSHTKYVTQAWKAHPAYTPPEGSEIDELD